MLLKFTQDGKFVAQYGKSGPLTSSADASQFGMVADFAEDAAANELYVADGYGNHRVVVIDEDTGAVKRMWGAYGKAPTDLNLPPYVTDSPQFGNPVHCIALAIDGLVYVCDRTNNRVQVFKKDGSYVRQFVFAPQTQASGSTWGIAFDPLDASQKYMILTDGTNENFQVVRRADGVVLGTFGHAGRNVGEFIGVHYSKFDSHGNLYTAEVFSGKRLQKWTPAE
jgi:DNA-binding beta-propeller fold protein YncE